MQSRRKTVSMKSNQYTPYRLPADHFHIHTASLYAVCIGVLTASRQNNKQKIHLNKICAQIENVATNKGKESGIKIGYSQPEADKMKHNDFQEMQKI